MDVIKQPVLGFDRLTEAEFFHFYQNHQRLRIGREANDYISIRPPVSAILSSVYAELS